MVDDQATINIICKFEARGPVSFYSHAFVIRVTRDLDVYSPTTIAQDLNNHRLTTLSKKFTAPAHLARPALITSARIQYLTQATLFFFGQHQQRTHHIMPSNQPVNPPQDRFIFMLLIIIKCGCWTSCQSCVNDVMYDMMGRI